MGKNELVKLIDESDLILVGLGEDFEDDKLLEKNLSFIRGLDFLKENKAFHLIPYWQEYCSSLTNNQIEQALSELNAILKDKNYYIVSTAISRRIAQTEWKNDRVVMPCGSNTLMQCNDCDEGITIIDDDTYAKIDACLATLYDKGEADLAGLAIGKCNKCGGNLIFNNIYADKYNENGYLECWNNYMKWLQGTVNRKVLILELGVGLQFPSVIRWPFEKVTLYNNKSKFVRVHETLYQLPEGMQDKGIGIAKNAIEWLINL